VQSAAAVGVARGRSADPDPLYRHVAGPFVPSVHEPSTGTPPPVAGKETLVLRRWALAMPARFMAAKVVAVVEHRARDGEASGSGRASAVSS
jgi:hypothetical protein